MEPKTILIVEDDGDILDSLRELLESEGYRVETATNGQAALNALSDGAPLPNLILLDLMMPVKDGFQFRQEQLQNEKLKDIPVVIMSADGHVDEKLKQTNSNAYLKKPVEIDAFLNTVKRFVS